MKKFIKTFLPLFIFTFSVSIKSNAQGNLQFNQVRFFEFSLTQSGSATYSETQQSVTVPVGKVLKIESAVSNAYASATNYSALNTNQAGMMLVNGKVIFQSYMAGNSPYFSQAILPLWLPAGTYTFSIKSNFASNGLQFVGYISGIEFNIVP